MLEVIDRLSLRSLIDDPMHPLTDAQKSWPAAFGSPLPLPEPGALVKRSWTTKVETVGQLTEVGLVIAVFDDYTHETLRAAVLWSKQRVV